MFECKTRFSQPHLSTYVLTLKLHRKLSTSVTQKVISRTRSRTRTKDRSRSRTRTRVEVKVRRSGNSSAIKCLCREHDSYAVSLTHRQTHKHNYIYNIPGQIKTRNSRNQKSKQPTSGSEVWRLPTANNDNVSVNGNSNDNSSINGNSEKVKAISHCSSLAYSLTYWGEEKRVNRYYSRMLDIHHTITTPFNSKEINH